MGKTLKREKVGRKRELERSMSADENVVGGGGSIKSNKKCAHRQIDHGGGVVLGVRSVIKIELMTPFCPPGGGEVTVDWRPMHTHTSVIGSKKRFWCLPFLSGVPA